MKKIMKFVLIFIGIFGLSILWFWADKNDYFNSKYRDLSEKEMSIFDWKRSEEQKIELAEIYKRNFNDTIYKFPRQKVNKIKCFQNIPMIGIFTGKTLKVENNIEFLNFCNNTSNFQWGETTWETSESEYYFNFYDKENRIIGKMYFCLKGCGMTKSRPFCPAMKFGGITKKAKINMDVFRALKTGIFRLINAIGK